MLSRCSRLVLAFAVLTAGSGVGLADDTHKPAEPGVRRRVCWSFWAVSTPHRIRCSRMTAHGSNIFRRQTSARWPNQAIRRSSRQSPPRPHRSRARQGRNKMNNKKRSVLLAAAPRGRGPRVRAAGAGPLLPDLRPARARRRRRCSGRACHPISRNCSRYGNQWNTLPPERQQALARGSQRWLGMTPEQKGLARQRFDRWHSLPPEQREQLRQRWQRFQSLPPGQQDAVRQNYRRFQQLPPGQRQRVARALA
jgi:hypothetical protein